MVEATKNQTISLTKKSYLIGLFIIFCTAYSQYLIRSFGLITGEVVVYGIPVLTIILFWKSTITRKAFRRSYAALKFGLAFFGSFTFLGLLAAAAIAYILVMIDPTTVSLLHRPNPVLHIPTELAWIMVWNSLLVVGPAEEYIFRGFIYGGLLSLYRDKHWLSLALISSILFALAHLYYVFVYGIASLVQLTDIVTFGMAMASTYYISGGNLLIPAVIHGIYDATGFLGVAISPEIGMYLRGIMILTGMLFAVIVYIQRTLGKSGIQKLQGGSTDRWPQDSFIS